jgi:hypothetical protein
MYDGRRGVLFWLEAEGETTNLFFFDSSVGALCSSKTKQIKSNQAKKESIGMLGISLSQEAV